MLSSYWRVYFGRMADQTFRLQNSPLGTLFIRFYRVVPYDAQTLERQVMADFMLAMGMGQAGVDTHRTLYQGPVLQNPVLIEAVARLAQRCPSCNCVHIERVP